MYISGCEMNLEIISPTTQVLSLLSLTAGSGSGFPQSLIEELQKKYHCLRKQPAKSHTILFMASNSDMSNFPWTPRLQDIDKLAKKFGVFVASIAIQFLRCSFLAPFESESQQDEDTALGNLQRQLRELLVYVAQLPTSETLEMNAHGQSLHSQAIIECELKLERFVAGVARVEGYLVRRENKLLKQLDLINKHSRALTQDGKKEIDYVRLSIARLRKREL
jgi:hypothetical protein